MTRNDKHYAKRKKRLQNRNYRRSIKFVKLTVGLTFTEIAGWMNLTPSNLRAMIHLGLNPTLEEWQKFKNGLKNYIISKKNERILVCVSQDKIAVCRRLGCNEQFIKWSWNAKDCEKHRRKSFKKYPIK